MSHRKRAPIAQQVAEDLHRYDSDRRDAFYGGLLGATLVATVVAVADVSVFAAFALAFSFLLSVLLLGSKVQKKPIMLGGAFRKGVLAGMVAFSVLVIVLRLVP